MSKLRPILILVILALTVSPVMAQYAFDFEIPAQGAVAGLVELTSYHNLVINTGTVSDTYEVNLVKELPADWVNSLCEGTLCYPPFVTQITFTLAPGDTTELLVDITPLTNLGSGSSIITLSSQGQPSLSITRKFTVVTPGLDVLLIDGDGGAAYETYYQDAITAQGLTYGRWDRDAIGSLGATELAAFPTVVWLGGDNSAAMTGEDLAPLQTYLQQGGDVIMSGQNLARDFCSPGGAQYSPANCALFNSIMGVDFINDNTNDASVAGLTGDPVAAGMSLNLSGGSSANANTSPDEITPTGGGIASIQYSPGKIAAVRSSYNLGRSYFMGFGFENISSSSNRSTLLANILTWLQQEVSATPDPVPSLLVGTPVAAPNPFNPRTHIRFAVGGERSVPGSVTVYDLTGRRIKELHNGSFAPGRVDIPWDGTDVHGTVVAGGIYLTRIILNGQTETLKITLAK